MRVTRTWFLVDDETRKKGRESWKERKGYKDGLVIWEREEANVSCVSTTCRYRQCTRCCIFNLLKVLES